MTKYDDEELKTSDKAIICGVFGVLFTACFIMSVLFILVIKAVK